MQQPYSARPWELYTICSYTRDKIEISLAEQAAYNYNSISSPLLVLPSARTKPLDVRTPQSWTPCKQLMLTVSDVIIKVLRCFLNSYQRFASGNGPMKWGIEKGNGPSNETLLFSINLWFTPFLPCYCNTSVFILSLLPSHMKIVCVPSVVGLHWVTV